MGLGSFFRGFFGSQEGEEPGEAVEYKGYTIRPAPRAEGGRYYLAGFIAKQFSDGPKEQHFIRADTYPSREAASEHAVLKAQQIIDEQGDGLFQ